MKKIATSICLVMLFNVCQAQLGIGTTSVDTSAMLDVVSSNKGLLPPRIALISAATPSPVYNPAAGLLIYNTATSGPDSAKVFPGYYFWNGNRWQKISSKGNNLGDILYWNGFDWVAIPSGTNGSVLTLCNGVPRWGSCYDSVVISGGPSDGNSMYVTVNDSDPNWASSNVYSNSFVNQELAIASSVNGNATITSRAFISFNLSSIPSNAQIVSAKLSLYGLPSSNTIPQGNVGANNILIQRVIDNWNQSTVNWNNQPPTTSEAQIELGATNSTFNYNITGIDVTVLVNAMRLQTPTKTAGFCLRLKTESIWRSVVFASNRNENLSKRPKLEIIYR